MKAKTAEVKLNWFYCSHMYFYTCKEICIGRQEKKEEPCVRCFKEKED